ncbi:VOC family protein [Roseobacter sinensis]|uniref:VOC family protein n=1 Tax=Roseobacter sinensis TaxID=2931391 RepID=A0ABT3BE88_9RHOB|nr:VOC family protein [Roseobacter sp. WL0113]MCV3271865.1 VOC family protein [Roseobacter sp. WL0113]
MEISRLDHVNLRTSNLEAMADWYTRVLGLQRGPRPDFGFPGAWLYIGDHAVVHLVGVSEECASIAPKIEHFAFRATGFDTLMARLDDSGIAPDVVRVPGLPIVQVNLADVDGNHIHIDFDSAEADAVS